jgi:hypothetical protein
MSEKRYVVPDGMLEAFWAEFSGGLRGVESHRRAVDGLEAALRWLAENPIVPDHAQAIHLCETFEDKGGSRKADYCDSIRHVAVEWQRRCFLEPAPELSVVPHIEDLVTQAYDRIAKITIGEALDQWPERIRFVAVEAYKRGKESR